MFGFLKKFGTDEKQSEIEELQIKLEELTEEINGKDQVIARLVNRSEKHPFLNEWQDLKKIEDEVPLAEWLHTVDLETIIIVLRSVDAKVGEKISNTFPDEELYEMAKVIREMPSYSKTDDKIQKIFSHIKEIYE